MRRLSTITWAALSLLMTDLAWADMGQFLDKGAHPSPSLFGLLARLVLSLTLIVGLIYASIYLLKRFSSGAKRKSARREIEVLERTFIAPKRLIYLVKVRSKTLVLGVTDSNISLLTELSEMPNQKDNSANSCFDPSVKNKTFSGLMQEMKVRFDSLWHKKGKDEV